MSEYRIKVIGLFLYSANFIIVLSHILQHVNFAVDSKQGIKQRLSLFRGVFIFPYQFKLTDDNRNDDRPYECRISHQARQLFVIREQTGGAVVTQIA
jgi:hypothetical protein